MDNEEATAKEIAQTLAGLDNACTSASNALTDLEAELTEAIAKIRSVMDTLPFEMQVRWLGRIQQARRIEARCRWELTHCSECGCLLDDGCLPDCSQVFYPLSLSLTWREEPGIQPYHES